MYTVELGKEIPDSRAGREKYPFNALEVSQSFFVPDGDLPASGSGVVRVQASLRGKRLGRKFTVAQVAGGVRVWRTA